VAKLYSKLGVERQCSEAKSRKLKQAIMVYSNIISAIRFGENLCTIQTATFITI